MPEALVPLATGLFTKVAGGLMDKAFSGGGKEKKGADLTQAVKPRAPLFAPSQIKQAQDQYTQQGNAKWNQIMAGMGAGGGTGGPDVTGQIGTQANALGSALQGLTTESGFGDNPMSNLDAILKSVEGGINPKYSVY